MAPYPRSLLIGPSLADLQAEGDCPQDTLAVSFARLGDIAPGLAEVDLVLAPLVCADFDAIEVIESLGRLGYRGRLRILAPKLPNRQIVLRELRAEALGRGIRVALVEAGQTTLSPAMKRRALAR